MSSCLRVLAVSRDVSEIIEKAIRDKFPDVVIESGYSGGILMLRLEAGSLPDVCRFLKESPDLAFDYLACVSGVDWSDRLEIVYHLQSLSMGHRLVLKVNADRDDARIPSVTSVWQGAGFQEREAYDLFGIVFEGHPDLRRILLPEDWDGYPLRKDYVSPD